MKRMYSCIYYKPDTNLNLTCTKYQMRCYLLGSLDCSDYEDTKDCGNCRHFTIETFDGVCEIYGVINEHFKEDCQFWKLEELKNDN